MLPQATGYMAPYHDGHEPTRERLVPTAAGVIDNLTQVILWRDNTMIKFIKNFRKDEDGAVTVDWVVLTAAVVALAAAAYSSIESGTSALAGKAETAISGKL